MIKEDILIINEGNTLASPSPFCTTVEPFRSILRRDRGSEGDAQGRKKLFAGKELGYVYGMCDYRSPYTSISEENRGVRVKNDIFGEDSDWEPDELIQQAIEKYSELYDSELIILLKSARNAIHNMSNFFNSLNLNERNDDGKLVHNPNSILTAMSKIGDIAKQIDSLEEMITKQEERSGKIRGDIRLNKWNR